MAGRRPKIRPRWDSKLISYFFLLRKVNIGFSFPFHHATYTFLISSPGTTPACATATAPNSNLPYCDRSHVVKPTGMDAPVFGHGLVFFLKYLALCAPMANPCPLDLT